MGDKTTDEDGIFLQGDMAMGRKTREKHDTTYTSDIHSQNADVMILKGPLTMVMLQSCQLQKLVLEDCDNKDFILLCSHMPPTVEELNVNFNSISIMPRSILKSSSQLHTFRAMINPWQPVLQPFVEDFGALELIFNHMLPLELMAFPKNGESDGETVCVIDNKSSSCKHVVDDLLYQILDETHKDVLIHANRLFEAKTLNLSLRTSLLLCLYAFDRDCSSLDLDPIFKKFDRYQGTVYAGLCGEVSRELNETITIYRASTSLENVAFLPQLHTIVIISQSKGVNMGAALQVERTMFPYPENYDVFFPREHAKFRILHVYKTYLISGDMTFVIVNTEEEDVAAATAANRNREEEIAREQIDRQWSMDLVERVFHCDGEIMQVARHTAMSPFFVGSNLTVKQRFALSLVKSTPKTCAIINDIIANGVQSEEQKNLSLEFMQLIVSGCSKLPQLRQKRAMFSLPKGDNTHREVRNMCNTQITWRYFTVANLNFDINGSLIHSRVFFDVECVGGASLTQLSAEDEVMLLPGTMLYVDRVESDGFKETVYLHLCHNPDLQQQTIGSCIELRIKKQEALGGGDVCKEFPYYCTGDVEDLEFVMMNMVSTRSDVDTLVVYDASEMEIDKLVHMMRDLKHIRRLKVDAIRLEETRKLLKEMNIDCMTIQQQQQQHDQEQPPENDKPVGTIRMEMESLLQSRNNLLLSLQEQRTIKQNNIDKDRHKQLVSLKLYSVDHTVQVYFSVDPNDSLKVLDRKLKRDAALFKWNGCKGILRFGCQGKSLNDGEMIPSAAIVASNKYASLMVFEQEIEIPVQHSSTTGIYAARAQRKEMMLSAMAAATVDEYDTCRLCLERPATIQYDPCQHQCCSSCAEILKQAFRKKCPICRQSFTLARLSDKRKRKSNNK